MRSISCTRCRRDFFSASAPRQGARCPICNGRLETAAKGDPGELPSLPLELPPIASADEGSYEARGESHRSLTSFVQAEPKRLPSKERDMGLRWRDGHDRLYRAAWVVDTGELILVQCGPPAGGGGHVEVLGTADDFDQLREALQGWELMCGRPLSAEWLRDRVDERLRTAPQLEVAGA